MTAFPHHHLLPVVAEFGVPDTAIAWAAGALRLLPPAVLDRLWARHVRLSVRELFPDDWEAQHWHGQPTDLIPWSECGGYWQATTGYATINAAWCKTRDEMVAVVLHELGHAYADVVLDGAHRRPEFRAAWSAARRRVQAEEPRQYLERRGLGMYCIHWTRGTAEAWADCFAWHFGVRATIHARFGQVYAQCLSIVQKELAA